MMAKLGQWFGFDSSTDSSPQPPHSPSSQPGIVISSNSKDKKPDHPTNADGTLRKTKSDEILRDFDVMRFLSRVDERLKEHAIPLPQADLDRLQTLHAQACVDQCALLIDIIDHFEVENDRLRHRLAAPAPSSAAADAVKAHRNMLVC